MDLQGFSCLIISHTLFLPDFGLDTQPATLGSEVSTLRYYSLAPFLHQQDGKLNDARRLTARSSDSR